MAVQAERLRDLHLKRDYTVQDRPRESFYVPCLQVASRYDRFAGYFRAASLEAVADEGLQRFFTNGGAIRIVVDAALTRDDVEQVRLGGQVGGDAALRDAVRRQVETAVLRVQLPGTERLSLVATLVAAGLMQVKVAVKCGPDGVPYPPEHPARQVFHDKVGILWDDEEDAVAFRGSLNETPAGWTRNYEGFSVYPSWDISVWDGYGAPLVERFEQAWKSGRAGEWRLFDLPDPAAERLVQWADPDRDWVHHEFEDPGERVVDPVVEAAEHPADYHADDADDTTTVDIATVRAERWSGLRTATVEPWPHQDAAARSVCDALWPDDGQPGEFGRLFADEVGLGKTIEVGLVVREALSNRGARRVLVLAPASVAPQWQQELWHKFSLWVPLLDRSNRLVWPDRTVSPVSGDPWRAADVMVASSQLARMSQHRNRVLDAGWDLLVVDEAHHARRADASRPGSANLLLRLLRSAHDAVPVRKMVLATATPMQMHVHEAWELLAVLGLPRAWDATSFETYFENLSPTLTHAERAWPVLQRLYAETVRRWGVDTTITRALEDRVGFVDAHDIIDWSHTADPQRAGQWPRDKADALVWWLSEQTPLRHLVHRASRHLLRHYQQVGIIAPDVVIPVREPADVLVNLSDDEQELYDRVGTWISRHYQTAKAEKKTAHGFVMTTYRRRLTSSLAAIRVSLARRADALTQQRNRAQQTLDLTALLDADDITVIEDATDTHVDETLTETIDGLQDELDELHSFVAHIDRVLDTNNGKDSKYLRFEQVMRDTVVSGRHRTAIVFTQYTDTMRWLQHQLAATFGIDAVACYSGEGGLLPNPDGDGWQPATKGQVTTAFRDAATNPDNPLRILLGTDAMSEGLNLQTSDLLINYDLPWNFMRVEQRIGRIDRINGPRVAHVRNMLIVGTVEERVYTGIVGDHDTFGTIIGPTGQVTGDPAVVLNQTEAAITAATMDGNDLNDTLEQLRAEARQARAQALTATTFDHSTLDGHNPDYGPWQFDRDSIMERIRQATRPDQTDTVWDADGRQVTFDPEHAAANPDVSLYVWGHPMFPAT